MEIKTEPFPEYNNGCAQPGAYVIRHIESKKIYVGSTGNLYQRKSNHRSNLEK